MTGPVAIVTCAGEKVDPDTPTLLQALLDEGVEAELCVWSDPSVEWGRFAFNVIRSTWDYTSQVSEFRRWVSSTPNLLNDQNVVSFSIDKHYLDELARLGISVIPTKFVDVGSEPVFPPGDFVVKPCIGAGSRDAERYDPLEHDKAWAHVASLHASGRDVMVQPYIASVDVEGETAMIFIDGEFSHAMRKAAMLNASTMDRSGLFLM